MEYTIKNKRIPVIPVKTGIQSINLIKEIIVWIPTYVGMTQYSVILLL